MNPFLTLSSACIALPVHDIDTDQIIPARFLKTTDKLGLGKSLFADWRYREDGSEEPSFILNQPAMRGRSVLIAGDNFGCGSSREHAPWALAAWGIRVLVSTSFADIFRNNALKNGLLLITIPEELHSQLLSQYDQNTDAIFSVDLQTQTFQYSDSKPHSFAIDAFSKRCLLQGLDQLQYILSFSNEISKFEESPS